MWIIKPPKNQEHEVFRLKYISAGPLATPELATEQAFDEILHFAEISRKNIHNKIFDQEALNNLDSLASLVDKAYEAMIVNLRAAHKGELAEISNAYNAEDRINNLRNHLRDSEIEDIESTRKNYQTSVYYMDVVSELEKMGDYIINISQTLEKVNIATRK